ncbi:MAG TPA: XRE family transcriptional regulator [Candidatus Binatia bacterium]|nr:XRE family transcriptional regulator [Candidatus Binatia bacterium]
MPRSIPALVKPALLIWARDRAGLPLEEAASKAGIESEQLRRWERGHDRPSISQLRKLGQIYKRPLAVFFLSEPPQGFDPQSEFRRLPGLTPQTESPALRLALRTALFRREAARELYERLNEPITECRVAANPNEDEELVGERVREALGITWEAQLNWPVQPPHYFALNTWRSAVERQGVLVFQTGDVELTEMRGTSIPHGPLPAILLNNNDAPLGRVFTIIHEFVHILLANGGHRTSAMEGRWLPEDRLLERVSNRFAAAALMPKREFLAEASNHPAAFAGDDEGLKRFANRIKVSPEAILRRLLSLHRVSPSTYRQKRQAWQRRSWYSPSLTAGGPSIQVRRVAEIGRPFIALVLEGYQRNAVSSSDVADYLGVQLKYVDRIANELVTAPGAAAVA